MTYEVLIIIVVINAVATLTIWRKVASKSNRGRPRLNNKAATALWRSDPPDVAGGKYPSLADDVDQLFFVDFKDFADVVNWWLGNEAIASAFRLQELPDDHLRLNPIDQPVLGRCFAIYYNQTQVGRLEITSGGKYTTENPEVDTAIEIDWARLFGYEELTEFLDGIAMHVASGNSDELRNARQSIQSALTKTLWTSYRVSPYDDPDDENRGELAVSFDGTARFYVNRRDAPARRA